MATIDATGQGKTEKNKRWLKRRKGQLLPDNFSVLTQPQQTEVLRGVVIVQARLIEHLLGEEED